MTDDNEKKREDNEETAESQREDKVARSIGSDDVECVGLLYWHAKQRRRLYMISIPAPSEDFWRAVEKMDVVVEGELTDLAR